MNEKTFTELNYQMVRFNVLQLLISKKRWRILTQMKMKVVLLMDRLLRNLGGLLYLRYQFGYMVESRNGIVESIFKEKVIHSVFFCCFTYISEVFISFHQVGALGMDIVVYAL